LQQCNGQQTLQEMCDAWNLLHPQDPPELSLAVLFQMERQGVVFFRENIGA